MQKPVLNHLGIIMDGNRRWAKSRGLPTLFGHKKGYEKVLKAGDWCLERGIKVLTVWAFSTENWKRAKKEVDYLMALLKRGLEKDVLTMHKKGIKVQTIGRLNQLPADLQKACQKAMTLTKNNAQAVLNIALNYGGQAEITDAVNQIIKKKIKNVTPKIFQEFLYDPKMSAPDLIIRTSGEQRTSGFLLWEAPYSELYFTQTCWPDFSEKDLDAALLDYQKRQRRFGGD
ncbi:MAG: di-trans,poly-cis-decaprenylcistransferase [Candidatus Komeilibacteria bacterium RIFCSPLOWO2_01_FULL_45_10]|uniref:Isoprenyl transferase n=1 Tax=Candidatus Komeilibacteria bacterium RIFCSPLOWO2_01_FULL_45_10 TaxID=1798550 RepID=A0A1G2BLK9_9BACT|nr:MAG: di-trans,poly-cis-decaprenylcistransferase [Candidatus Komeilibacteria bacterium RIFCSPLOWO2_01_FULL_45_10]